MKKAIKITEEWFLYVYKNSPTSPNHNICETTFAYQSKTLILRNKFRISGCWLQPYKKRKTDR